MRDEVISLLENTELRTKCSKYMEERCGTTEILYNARADVDLPDDDWQSWWHNNADQPALEPKDVFDKNVIRKMKMPPRVTLEELNEAFFSLATPNEENHTRFCQFAEEDWNNIYSAFLNHVENNVLRKQRTDPFPVCIIKAESVSKEFARGLGAGYELARRHAAEAEGNAYEPILSPDDTDDETEETTQLWNKNGVGVRVLAGGDLPEPTSYWQPGDRFFYLNAVVEGPISKLALDRLKTEIGAIVRTGFWSIRYMRPGENAEEPDSRVFDMEVKLSRLSLKHEFADGLPIITDTIFRKGRSLVAKYLDAYYADLRKKDAFQRRIRNAVWALVESDKQADLLAIAMSMVAIEALLGEKGNSIATTLSQNIAVLLEPDLDRRGKAIEFVKDLYDIRSRVLHGERIEAEQQFRTQARHLAAAVLSGVISRRDFLLRAGYEHETPQDLLKTLKDGTFQTGQPLGVEVSNVRTLWNQ